VGYDGILFVQLVPFTVIIVVVRAAASMGMLFIFETWIILDMRFGFVEGCFNGIAVGNRVVEVFGKLNAGLVHYFTLRVYSYHSWNTHF
jgi:hypothetical protein